MAADVTGLPARDVGRDAEFGSDPERRYQVRRRVLDVQLARLACRLAGTDVAARDAAARTLSLVSRLERNELEW